MSSPFNEFIIFLSLKKWPYYFAELQSKFHIYKNFILALNCSESVYDFIIDIIVYHSLYSVLKSV